MNRTADNREGAKFCLILIILLSSCAPKEQIEPPPNTADYQRRLNEADTLFIKGCYSCLSDAYQIYQGLLSFPFDQQSTLEKLFQTALLLALREKELGILDGPYQKKAADLLPGSPSPEFSLYLDIVNSVAVRLAGRASDSIENDLEDLKRRRRIQDSEESMTHLKEQAEAKAFGAYLYLSLICSPFSLVLNNEDIKKEAFHLLEIHSESLPLRFKSAICRSEDRERLEEIVQAERCFQEAYLFLGEVALKQGHLITAERNYLKAYHQFPDSLAILSSLATIHFGLGETEKSLEFHEKTLALTPDHRNALLGKAICLGYLGEHQQAIQALHALVSLGKWYLGDAHYWLAWNEHELEHLEQARDHIENAKSYLPMDSETFGLSGTIALEQGRLDTAEKDLKDALSFDSSNCEAAFYLGKVYSNKKDWESSGHYYERAALCHADTGKTLENMVIEIRASSLSKERKQQLLLRREVQWRKAILNEATSFYDAAAGYFNSGIAEKALDCAQRAFTHDLFRDKAEELIEKIREIRNN